MTSIFQIAKSAIADRRGVTAMEYGLIAGVLAVGLATAFTALSGRLTNASNAPFKLGALSPTSRCQMPPSS